MIKNEKGCWYLIEITECVLCGRTHEIRERQAAPSPPKEAYEKRYHYRQDACPQHFI